MATISTSRIPLVTSTQLLRTNLITDPSAEIAGTWSFNLPANAPGANSGAPSGSAAVGLRVARATFATVPAASPASWSTPRVPVTVGQVVSAAISPRVINPAAAVASARCDISFYTGAGALVQAVSGVPSALIAAQWGRVSNLGVTVPAGSVTASVSLAISNPAAWVSAAGTTIMDADAASLIVGAAAGSYFDGYFAAPGYVYAWTGAPNASQSTESSATYDTVSSTTPELVLGYESSRRSRNKVHEILGGATVVSLGEAGLRTGRLELFYLTEQAAADAEIMHSRPAVFTLTTPDRLTTAMKYTLADGGALVRTLDDETRARWVVAVDFQEVLA